MQKKKLSQTPAVDMQKVPRSFCCYSKISPRFIESSFGAQSMFQNIYICKQVEFGCQLSWSILHVNCRQHCKKTHSTSCICTVTVHQSLVEALLEKFWSNDRSFLGVSAFEWVFFAMWSSSLKRYKMSHTSLKFDQHIISFLTEKRSKVFLCKNCVYINSHSSIYLTFMLAPSRRMHIFISNSPTSLPGSRYRKIAQEFLILKRKMISLNLIGESATFEAVVGIFRQDFGCGFLENMLRLAMWDMARINRNNNQSNLCKLQICNGRHQQIIDGKRHEKYFRYTSSIPLIVACYKRTGYYPATSFLIMDVNPQKGYLDFNTGLPNQLIKVIEGGVLL
ncbi:hypothetical protein VP01_3736g1 [Puccinia sorghi]|uniref:Uncharacterized protein n=1 Tax=Puccinia sorghi TaxID=27349 RepID=A0A0L6UU25_9BASI|nr:hypothetical protein VP01_3736g1 [Puccinia sorghi]